MHFPSRKTQTPEMEPRIRVSMNGGGRITLDGLTPVEIEQLEAMVRGTNWCAVTAGRLSVRDRLAQLPGPAEDSAMMPFWRMPIPGEVQCQLFEVHVPLHSCASINIESLCGYNYSEENYAEEAERLEGYGFICLRSRRTRDDGTFGEMWHLSGLWSARGALKERVNRYKTEQQKTEAAIHFLCRTVQFGSLSVGWQRAAMAIE